MENANTTLNSGSPGAPGAVVEEAPQQAQVRLASPASWVVEGHKGCPGCGKVFAPMPHGFAHDLCPACIEEGLQIAWCCPQCSRPLVGGKYAPRTCPASLGCLPPPAPPAPPLDPVLDPGLKAGWAATTAKLEEAEAALVEAASVRARRIETEKRLADLTAELTTIHHGGGAGVTVEIIRTLRRQRNAAAETREILVLLEDHLVRKCDLLRRRAQGERSRLRSVWPVAAALTDAELTRLAREVP